MSIPVTCHECDSHFHVEDEFAGRPGRCPDCEAILQVPDLAASADHSDHLDPLPLPSSWRTSTLHSPPIPSREIRRDQRQDHERTLRQDYVDQLRRFDPLDRAARWARVHRGLGHLQVAVVLGFLSQILQTLLMLARGGVQQDPNALPDSGQIALVFGALVMMLASGMFWILARAAGVRVPYVPARNCARPSFLMTLGCVATGLITICLFFATAMAMAQAGPNGGPPPGAVVFVLMFMLGLCLTGGLALGAEIAGLMSLGRIGDALRDRAAARWARRSIIVMVLTGGLIVFGAFAILVYIGAEQQKRQEQAKAGAQDPAGAKEKPKEMGKDKAVGKAKADNAKEAAPAQAPAAGPAQNPPPEPIDGTVAVIFDLIFFVPLIVFLFHYSVALQAGRRAIRREIDVLTGKEHSIHDHHY
jgi:hypothetical protein